MKTAYEEYFDSLAVGEVAMSEAEFNEALASVQAEYAAEKAVDVTCGNCGSMVKAGVATDGGEFGYDVLCMPCQHNFYRQWSGENDDD